MMISEKKSIAGLWKKTFNRKDGGTFDVWSGSFPAGTYEDSWISIEKTRNKEDGDKKPEYNVYLKPKAKKEVPYAHEVQKKVDDIPF